MEVFKILLKWLIGILVVMQIISFLFVSFPKNIATNPNKEIKAPKEIMALFKVSCYDCHSNHTNYPWYTKISPLSFQIARHVDLGRKWLNFSKWEEYSDKQKDEKLEHIYKAVHTVMPLSGYVMFHPKAALSQEQRKMIRDWTGKAPF